MFAGSESDQDAIPGYRELRRPLVPGIVRRFRVHEAPRLSRRIPLTCGACLPGRPNCSSAKRRRRSLGCDGPARPTPRSAVGGSGGICNEPEFDHCPTSPSRSSDNPTAAPGGMRPVGGLRKAGCWRNRRYSRPFAFKRSYPPNCDLRGNDSKGPISVDSGRSAPTKCAALTRKWRLASHQRSFRRSTERGVAIPDTHELLRAPSRYGRVEEGDSPSGTHCPLGCPTRSSPTTPSIGREPFRGRSPIMTRPPFASGASGRLPR